MASKGYRNVLFGGQTLTSASDGGYQREGQVGAANIFGGAPQQGRVPQQVTAQQPTFAQLQAQGVARPAPVQQPQYEQPQPSLMDRLPAAIQQPVYTMAQPTATASVQSPDTQSAINKLYGISGVGAEKWGDLSGMSVQDIDALSSTMASIANGDINATRNALTNPHPFVQATAKSYLAGYGSQGLPSDYIWTRDPTLLRSSTGTGGIQGTDLTGSKSATPTTFVANPAQSGTGGSGGIPSLPDYASLYISDSDLLSRVNALLGRSGGLSVGAPNISPVGGITAPTMERAAQGPGATSELQNQFIQSLQAALATPSRYDLPTFTKIRDAALADIQAQYGEQQRQQAAQLAARGLSASSIAARAGESLGERQARAIADLNANLLQQAATTQAADRTAALQAAQTGITQIGAQQIDRFNALQNQYANALSEGRLQDALRIQTEQQNIQTGLQALQAVLGQNLNAAQLQQGGALGAATLSLQERKMLMDLLLAIYNAQSTTQQTSDTPTKTGTGTGTGGGTGGGTGTGGGDGSGGNSKQQF